MKDETMRKNLFVLPVLVGWQKQGRAFMSARF